MTITVYGASLSPYVRKVCVTLKEKGLAYEQEQIDPARLPENYQTLSPFERIPALKDNGNVLADSGVIFTYLENQYPNTSLTYADAYLKARVQWFEKFGDYELGPVATFGVFRNRVLMKLQRKESDEGHVQSCLAEKLPPLLDYLEANAPNEGFIVGEKLTIADIAICTHFANMGYGKETIDATRWPKSDAYVKRILGRESFATLIAQETAFIEKIFAKLGIS